MTNQCANGHDNTPSSAFCSTCGTRIVQSDQSDAAQTRPTHPQPPQPEAAPTATPVPGVGEPAQGGQGQGPATKFGPNAPRGGRGAEMPASKRNLFVGIGVGVLLVALVLGGVLFSVLGDDPTTTAKDNGRTVRGIVALYDTEGSLEGSWDDCEGTGGYSDIGAGMSLKVKGANDEIVGSGSVVNISEENIEDVAQAELDGDHAMGLEATTPEANTEELRDLLELGESISCILYFEASIEPSDYYSIELSERGALNYSKEELAEKGYVVGFSIGDL